MDTSALDFFKKILETPSPSGYERPVQEQRGVVAVCVVQLVGSVIELS
jgi:hypothetical protein